MARKNKNLASFNDVARNNINKNVDVNNNININDNNNDKITDRVNDSANTNIIEVNIPNENEDINNNVNINNKPQERSYLDTLIEGKAKKSNEAETVLTGIYLQKDLSKILDSLAKKGGKGAKSRIVNEALRSIFIEKGLL
ncbi:MAG: hypothetical protein Q8934_14370 [Bacillota bacterium]|nr:hypothetical protein [Bacillota bacterium]